MSSVGRYLKQEVSRLQEENKELKEEVLSLRQYIGALDALVQAIDEMDPGSEVIPLLDRILYNALMVINTKDGSLLVLDENTGELVFVLAYGEASKKGIIGTRIPSGKGIAGWVVKNKKTTIAQNAYSDTRFYSGIDSAFQFQTESVLAAPLIGGGRVLGVIELLNKHDQMPFNEADQTLLTLLCRFAGQILYEMVRQEEQIEASEAEGAAPAETPPTQ